MRNESKVASTMYPVRRTDVIEAVVDEDLLLYDPCDHHAYRLNQSAATLWRRCDGNTPVDDILQGEKGAWDLLTGLAADGLVADVPDECPRPDVSRRSFVRAGTAAVAGVVMIPLMEKIIVPTPAAAASGMNPPYPGGVGGGGGGSPISGGTYPLTGTWNGYTLSGTVDTSTYIFTGTLTPPIGPSIPVSGPVTSGNVVSITVGTQTFSFTCH
ncbi:MAG: hypothetical protein NVS4B2_32760 [Chloroflexota bacterium]